MFSRKRTLTSLLLLGQLSILSTFAQDLEEFRLHLKGGSIIPAENLSIPQPGDKNARTKATFKQFLIVQFSEIPAAAEVEALRNAGVTLLDYIPNLAYTATVTGQPNTAVLKKNKVRSIVPVAASQKIDILLTKKANTAANVRVRLRYPASFSYEEVVAALEEEGIAVPAAKANEFRMLTIEIPSAQLTSLAGNAWVEYLASPLAPAAPLLDKSTANTKANVLHSAQLLGYSLKGDGVTIGIGDNASLLSHADVRHKVIAQKSLPNAGHGLHVAGIVAGAGVVNERFTGYAPNASLISVENSEMIEKASFYSRAFGMVVTNNSYGSTSIEGCGTFGGYDFSSYNLDNQAYTLPNLLHIFAAGNSGKTSCSIPGFGTVFGEFASAKNSITVGQVAQAGEIAPTSSKGPTRDGRIKPEITAPGSSIASLKPNDLYTNGTGTSMAAPAVTGGVALLYQRYRQLHDGQNPKNALIKAIVLNGATDRGLPGPDFSFGFGNMNLLHSVKMLDNGAYLSGNVGNGQEQQHQINVPGNVAAVKIMLYWNDPGASPYSDKSLVNNLDLHVTAPGDVAYLPLVPDQNKPDQAAMQVVDDINNVEQVVIENPASGSYTLKISGKTIPQNSQEYFVVYDFIEKNTTLTYPIGGERLSKGDAVSLSWDTYTGSGNTFTLSYSGNDGQSWTEINNAISGQERQFAWTVPDISTTSAKVQIRNNQTGETSTSAAFTILGLPGLSFNPTQCESYAALQWTAVPEATDYEVMILKGETMQSVATTTDLKYTFSNLATDSTYYFSVRARKNGMPGRRSLAISRKPDNGNCSGSISDRDLAVVSIISPSGTGRMHTSTSLSTDQKITVQLKNLDDQSSLVNAQVGFEIPGKTGIQWEPINKSLGANETYNYTFNKTVDLSQSNTYTIKVFVRQDGDVVEGNNFRTRIFQQLANQRLALPYFENFESLNSVAVIKDSVGLAGINPFDFATEASNGRLSNRLAPSLAYSGSNSLTFDSRVEQLNGNENSLVGTFNLLGYRADKQDIKMSFRYRSLNNMSFLHNGNLVYIRGNEKDPWIVAYNLEYADSEQQDRGYRLISIPLSEILKQNNQAFSASFQIKWSNSSFYPFTVDGYNIDDVQIFSAGGAALPVELATFNAKPASENKTSTDVLLDWTTASEKDFDHFEVEAANEAEMRDSQFRFIASVAPHGAANQTAAYTYLDKSPKHGTVYYRLKMVDTDGSTAYSTIRSVTLGDKNSWLVYPNPAVNQVFVDLGEKTEKITHLQLIDVSGRIDKETFANTKGGKAELTLPAHLPSGSYFLKIISNGHEETHRIVKK